MEHFTTNEELRQQIEKILWREYNPKMSPNMEEVSEEILYLVLASLEEAMPKDEDTSQLAPMDNYEHPEYDQMVGRNQRNAEVHAVFNKFKENNI